MKGLCLLLVLGFIPLGCSTPVDTPDPVTVECLINSPAPDALVSDTVEVEVDLEGLVTLVELRVADQVIGSVEVEVDDETAIVSWDTTDSDDGEIELTARVVSEDPDVEAESETVTVIVDNTAPTAELTFEHRQILEGQVDVPATINEENIAELTLLGPDGELVSSTDGSSELSWDTTNVEAGFHMVRLQVVDKLGRSAETDEIEVIVTNNAYILDQSELSYNPRIMIPDPFDPEADLHRRIAADLDLDGTDPENIVRVMTWVTWEADGDWTIEYAFGQGVCPHHGVEYTSEESSEGEIMIDLAWVDVAEIPRNRALANDPDHSEDAVTYPFNTDPRTCGSFFGHVAVVNAEDHPGEDLTFTANFMFIYGD